MNTPFKVIVIGGSAGSFLVVSKILSSLKPDFKIPIVLCLHRLKNVSTGFEEALNIKSIKQVKEPSDRSSLKQGGIYLAPSNYHLLAEIGNCFSLSVEDLYMYSRPSIDLCLDSFSYIYKEKMLAIILSGANSDGAEGMFNAHVRGALTIVQSPEEATVKTMVQSTLQLFNPTAIYNTDEIIAFLNDLP